MTTNGATADAQDKQLAAIKSVVAAFGLTGMKLVVGWMTGSLGVLAEAAHSGLDLMAAIMTLLVVRMSSKPADEDHPYGHAKFENVSALVETFLLLITCALIVREGIGRLFTRPQPVDASIWAFLAVLVSLAVDFSRARLLEQAARKHKSQALEADAIHFQMDFWSSSVVLAGLAGVKLAQWFPGLSYLNRCDAAAALVVAGIVAFVCSRLGHKTLRELMDTAPKKMAEQVKAVIESVDNVQGSHAIRVRSAGPKVFIDAHVVLDGSISLAEAHRILDRVEAALEKAIPGADITVHPEPSEEAGSGGARS